MQHRNFACPLVLAAIAASGSLASDAPRAGDPADIAPFGAVVVWAGDEPRDLVAKAPERRDGALVPSPVQGAGPVQGGGPAQGGGTYLGIEWDAPRIVSLIAVRFHGGSAPADAKDLRVEYWHKTWDGRATPASGWAQIDDPLTGSWKRAHGAWRIEGSTFTFAFAEKLSDEIEKAGDVPFRKAYKFRVLFGPAAPLVDSMGAFSPGKWTACALDVQGLPAAAVPAGAGAVRACPVEIANGLRLDGPGPIEIAPGRTASLRLLRLDLSILRGPTPRDERTLVTIAAPRGKISFSVEDALEAPLPIPDFGILVQAPGAPPAKPTGAQRVLNALRSEPEQTWSRARREVVAPQKTLQRGEVRYTPLSWDSHRQKFMVFHDGSVAMDIGSGKLWETSPEKLGWPAGRLHYRFLVGKDLWKHEGEHDNRQELEDGYLPVLRTTWDRDAIRYEETAFATLSGAKPDHESLKGNEPEVLLLRFRVTNLETQQQTGRIVIAPGAKEKPALSEEAGPAGARLAILAPGAAGNGRVRMAFRWRAGEIRMPESGENKPEASIEYAVDLGPLHTESLDVLIPFDATTPDLAGNLRALDFDRERAAVIASWRKLLDAEGSAVRVSDPAITDFIRANRAHIAISVQRDLKTGFDMVPAATFNYDVCMNEACYQILAMDVQGLHRRAERYLEPFLRLQGTQGLDGGFRSKEGVFHGLPVEGHNYQGFRYNLDHGFVLWTLGEHYLLSGDKDWMARNAGAILAGCDFIIRERKAAREAPGGDRPGIAGLVPPGHLEDVAEWHRWFAVNSYFHLGLQRAGTALSAFGHPRSRGILAEAGAYRADIARAAAFARERSPAVRLRDGTAVPLTPSRADLRGREVGWIREQLYGSIHLILGEVLPPLSTEAGWIVQDFEDNLFLKPEYGRQADLPEYWFSHGGQAVQSNLVPCLRMHLMRGDHPAAVRTLLNNLATNLFEDVRQSTEHPVERFGHGRGPFYKSSDEGSWVVSMRNALVFERDPGTLWLLAAAPRRWFAPGEVISARAMASWFGPCGVLVEGGADSVRARVTLPSRNPPGKCVLFLRHWEGKPLRSAFLLDGGGARGKALPLANAAEGGVDLSGLSGEIQLEGQF